MGTAVTSGNLSLEWSSGGHTGTTWGELEVTPRSRGFTVEGSAPPLGQPGYGDEPVTGQVINLGENIRADGTSGIAPEGAGQWQTDVVSSGPNEGLAYVTSHNYSMDRTCSTVRSNGGEQRLQAFCSAM